MTSSGPPALTPGQALAGGGVGGTLQYTWTIPPIIAWQGWVPTGETWAPTEQWSSAQWSGTQLQAFYPTQLPDDAGPPPQGGGRYLIVRVVPPGGWCTDLL
jgi:hypothetical protein